MGSRIEYRGEASSLLSRGVAKQPKPRAQARGKGISTTSKPRAKRKLDRAQPQEEGRHRSCAAPNGASVECQSKTTGSRPWLKLYRRSAAKMANLQSPARGGTEVVPPLFLRLRSIELALRAGLARNWKFQTTGLRRYAAHYPHTFRAVST